MHNKVSDHHWTQRRQEAAVSVDYTAKLSDKTSFHAGAECNFAFRGSNAGHEFGEGRRELMNTFGCSASVGLEKEVHENWSVGAQVYGNFGVAGARNPSFGVGFDAYLCRNDSYDGRHYFSSVCASAGPSFGSRGVTLVGGLSINVGAIMTEKVSNSRADGVSPIVLDYSRTDFYGEQHSSQEHSRSKVTGQLGNRVY
jgi:hypothetical protein